MTVRELGHLVLYVRDVRRSAAFYRDVLGWRQILPEPGEEPVGAAAFSSGRTHHELLADRGRCGRHADTRRAGGSGCTTSASMSATRDDDLRAALGQVQAAGATVVGTSDHTVTHSLYILDPDGNEIELYVDVPGVDWRVGPGARGRCHPPAQALSGPVEPRCRTGR